jgi:hypothetical protein
MYIVAMSYKTSSILKLCKHNHSLGNLNSNSNGPWTKITMSPLASSADSHGKSITRKANASFELSIGLDSIPTNMLAIP